MQNSSEISVNFDPAYEPLIFHTIRIIRDGKSLHKLQLSNFKTIQQEKDVSKFTGSSQSLGNNVLRNYEYENLKDNVMPDEAANFFSSYDEEYAASGFELSYKPGDTASLNSYVGDTMPTVGVFS